MSCHILFIGANVSMQTFRAILPPVRHSLAAHGAHGILQFFLIEKRNLKLLLYWRTNTGGVLKFQSVSFLL